MAVNFHIKEVRVRVVCPVCDRDNWIFQLTENMDCPCTSTSKPSRCFFCKTPYAVRVMVERLDVKSSSKD